MRHWDRPWDKHPPWAHWGFFVIWLIAGSLGPIALIVGLMNGRSSSVWIGLALCGVWVLDLGADWIVVRTRRNQNPGWTPWEPRIGRHQT